MRSVFHLLLPTNADFIFREFTWFASAEDFDNADSKIRAIAPQHPAADLFVFLAICGLLFAFMILSTNSPKSEASSYNTSNIETTSMTFEEDPSSFWYSKTEALTNYFHACGDSIGPSRDVVFKMQNISRPVVSNIRMLPSKDLDWFGVFNFD